MLLQVFFIALCEDTKKKQVVIYYWPSPRPVFWSLKSWTREPDQSYSW